MEADDGVFRRFDCGAVSVLEQLGGNANWVTEAYACTMPHSDWHDTERRAAENVVLTYVIGLAEGMKAVMFYQLRDATWSDLGGIDTADSEHYYGLLRRDGAVKPSLLAYCAVSEALDGAVFRRYLSFPEGQTKGVLFDTPRGPLAVLWDRTEGYVQSERKPGFASPEPWRDHWTRHASVTLSAALPQVALTDCIGRKSLVEAQGGRVALTLTGAPVMVTGLRF